MLARRLTLTAIILSACTLAGCNDGQPIVLQATRIVSPDSKWEAVLEQVDNGLGFGQGRLLHEIHVQPAGSRVTHHGDGSVTCVFYADASSEAPKVEWVAARRLVVTYSGLDEIGRQIPRFMDVEIEYRPADPKYAVRLHHLTAASDAGD